MEWVVNSTQRHSRDCTAGICVMPSRRSSLSIELLGILAAEEGHGNDMQNLRLAPVGRNASLET
jgi:hypothetical protein